MKYTLRVLLCLLLALSMTLPMAACGGGSWRDDLTAAQVCDSVVSAIPSEDGWRAVSDKYISPSSWGEDYTDYLEKVAEYRIMIAEDESRNINEVGVFRCKSEKDAKAVKEFCENYLNAKALQLKPLLETYNPTEITKLDYATVNVVGRYVMYSILNASDTTTAGSALEKALTPAE